MSRNRVALYTLGCKVNHYETEAISEQLTDQGYERVNFGELADLYIINTCTVTNNADRKSRQMIRRAIKRNPQATIVVIGCYSQIAIEKVASIPGVDFIIGTEHKNQVAEMIVNFQATATEQQQLGSDSTAIINVTDIMKMRNYEELSLTNLSDRTRATVKIQDGCNNFCTYCIIPWARGLSRSRDPVNIINQAKQLALNGYNEIVLTGIHTGAFGEDLANYSLAELLKDLETIEDLKRIRISSIEVTQINDELLEVLAKSKKISKHLHIPLQAGDDRILSAMRRNYDTKQFSEKLLEVRKILPNIAITTDVIAGFPGETEENYLNGYNFIKESNFSQLHVFSYSKRSGTPAAKMDGQVAEEEKHQRVTELIELSDQLAISYRNRYLNENLEVIPEQSNSERIPKGFLVGHSDNYIPLIFKAEKDLIGQLCLVRLDEVKADVCKGTFVRIL